MVRTFRPGPLLPDRVFHQGRWRPRSAAGGGRVPPGPARFGRRPQQVNPGLACGGSSKGRAASFAQAMAVAVPHRCGGHACRSGARALCPGWCDTPIPGRWSRRAPKGAARRRCRAGRGGGSAALSMSCAPVGAGPMLWRQPIRAQSRLDNVPSRSSMAIIASTTRSSRHRRPRICTPIGFGPSGKSSRRAGTFPAGRPR